MPSFFPNDASVASSAAAAMVLLAHFGHVWAQTRAIPANLIQGYFAGHSRF
jgi:hypothetical protein